MTDFRRVGYAVITASGTGEARVDTATANLSVRRINIIAGPNLRLSPIFVDSDNLGLRDSFDVVDEFGRAITASANVRIFAKNPGPVDELLAIEVVGEI